VRCHGGRDRGVHLLPAPTFRETPATAERLARDSALDVSRECSVALVLDIALDDELVERLARRDHARVGLRHLLDLEAVGFEDLACPLQEPRVDAEAEFELAIEVSEVLLALGRRQPSGWQRERTLGAQGRDCCYFEEIGPDG
jgi:hypothetical protein